MRLRGAQTIGLNLTTFNHILDEQLQVERYGPTYGMCLSAGIVITDGPNELPKQIPVIVMQFAVTVTTDAMDFFWSVCNFLFNSLMVLISNFKSYRWFQTTDSELEHRLLVILTNRTWSQFIPPTFIDETNVRLTNDSEKGRIWCYKFSKGIYA